MDPTKDATTGEPYVGTSSDIALFESLYPALRRFAAVVADLDMDPDDLVQDALAATLARTTLSEIRQPTAYLKRAIVNGVANRRRRSGRFRGLMPKLAADIAGTDFYPSDLAILDALSPRDRAVLYLADVEGLPLILIAEELGVSSSLVRKRASRARSQLRSLLQADSAAVAAPSPPEVAT